MIIKKGRNKSKMWFFNYFCIEQLFNKFWNFLINLLISSNIFLICLGINSIGYLYKYVLILVNINDMFDNNVYSYEDTFFNEVVSSEVSNVRDFVFFLAVFEYPCTKNV